MKGILSGILLGFALLFISACKDCSLIEDNGNPVRQFRLLDNAGNDLWFGANATYDPQEVVFEHETAGVLNSQVNQGDRSVDVVIPMTNGNEQRITLRFDSTRADALRYTALLYDEKCKRNYELSYMYQNNVEICSLCGTTQFENDGFIYLLP